MKITFNNKIPIFNQIMDSIKHQVISGELRPGDKLHSVRDMAQELEVNPNTIQRAYQELEREGFTFTQRGLGNFITEDKGVIDMAKRDMSSDIVKTFVEGMRGLGFAEEDIFEALRAFFGKGKV